MNLAQPLNYRPRLRPDSISRPRTPETPSSSATEVRTYRGHHPTSTSASRWTFEDGRQQKTPDDLGRERKIAFVTFGWFVMNCALVYGRSTNSWLSKCLAISARSDHWILKAINILHASNALSDVILIYSVYHQPQIQATSPEESPLRRRVKVFILWNSVTMVLIWCASTAEIFLSYAELDLPPEDGSRLKNTTDEDTKARDRAGNAARAAPYILILFALTALAALKAIILVHVYADYLCAVPTGSRWTSADNAASPQGSISSQGDATALWKRSMRRRQGSRLSKRASRTSSSVGGRSQISRNHSLLTDKSPSRSSIASLPACLEHWFQSNVHRQDTADCFSAEAAPQHERTYEGIVFPTALRDRYSVSEGNKDSQCSRVDNQNAVHFSCMKTAVCRGQPFKDGSSDGLQGPEKREEFIKSAVSRKFSSPFLPESGLSGGAAEFHEGKTNAKRKNQQGMPLRCDGADIHKADSTLAVTSFQYHQDMSLQKTSTKESSSSKSTVPQAQTHVNSTEQQTQLSPPAQHRQDASQSTENARGCSVEDTNIRTAKAVPALASQWQESLTLEDDRDPKGTSAGKIGNEKIVFGSADFKLGASQFKNPLQNRPLAAAERWQETNVSTGTCAQISQHKRAIIDRDNTYQASLLDQNMPIFHTGAQAATVKENALQEGQHLSSVLAEEADCVEEPRSDFPKLSMCGPVPVIEKRNASEGITNNNVPIQAIQSAATSTDANQTITLNIEDKVAKNSRQIRQSRKAGDARGHTQQEYQHGQ